MLAVVQAFVLKELLFTGSNALISPSQRYDLLSSPPDVLKQALIGAWTDILWRVGDERRVRVCLRNPSGSSSMKGSTRKMADGAVFKYDGCSEHLQMIELTSKSSVRNFFTVHHSTYVAPRGYGCVLFLYSIILTRSVESIEQDRDEQSSLIGAHSYTTQEMVNLALTGRARSNVFNGTKNFDGLILRGIDQRSEIGFLSLFEHYNNIEVGSYLKQPLYPIWVICSESHYTVAWCHDMAAVESTPPGNGKFDLMYYDELANQNEEIRLTVDTTKKSLPTKDDLEPPINECIRTKWGKNARIDWNGVEPIL